jgi:hypothetical protein
MHFISYYYDKNPSESTYYSTCAANLAKQLSSYGYEYSFDYINFDKEGLDSTYLKLNMIKPSFILKKIKELNDSVIWIDADCYLKARLEEFENLQDFDIGYCIRHHDNKTPHAAILYFNNTDNAKQFLRDWQAINEIKEKDDTYHCSEHCTLIDLLNETKIPLNIKEFRGIAHSGVYEIGQRIPVNTGIKLWIGISPDAWEYERTKNQ